MDFFAAGPQWRPQNIAIAILMVSGYSADKLRTSSKCAEHAASDERKFKSLLARWMQPHVVPEGSDAPSDLRYGRLFTGVSSGATYMVLSVFRSFNNKLRATKSVAFPASASSRVHGLRVLRQGLSLTAGEYVPMSPQEIINIPASEVLEIGVLLAQK